MAHKLVDLGDYLVLPSFFLAGGGGGDEGTCRAVRKFGGAVIPRKNQAIRSTESFRALDFFFDGGATVDVT